MVDPPWKYGKWGGGSGKVRHDMNPNAENLPLPYQFMEIDLIKSLKIANHADADCELYLWTTQKYLQFSFEIVKQWGFKYCQILTWCKTPRGTGQGGIYCPTTEFLLLSRIGKMPQKQRINSTWFHTKRPHNSHSTKPEFFQDLIETVSDAPRLELFARRKRPGWDVWGNEVESDLEILV